MSFCATLLGVLLLTSMSGLAQGKEQPLPKDLTTVPSLNRSFDQGMEGLGEHFKMKKRDSLTPGIDNWFGEDKRQRVGLSLKCIGKTVVAGSIEVPMIYPEAQEGYDQLMTLDKFLTNLCPKENWGGAHDVLQLAGVIEQVSKDNTKMFNVYEENGILIFALAMPSRKTVQFNIISTELVKKYDFDAL